ncbi:MAG: hypothetical protein K6G10_04390, partial [Butyrivibrio sp.]|nr:hypothetical protein [Butyrivibrio sp.]
LFSRKNDIDIVMFGEDFVPTKEELEPYASKGCIEPYESDCVFYPNYGREPLGDCGQILWINFTWLERLGLEVPKTTEELKEVLVAFRDMDPNGNGLNDEIPLLSCDDGLPYRVSELLLEPYVYNDPYHDREELSKDPEYFAGISYCNDLKKEELLLGEGGRYSMEEYTELINSPLDIVGAFTADSLSKVIYQGNPEIMAGFMHVAPIAGPKGVRNALYVERKPKAGAIICSASGNKDKAKLLLDTMMTPEASLIARYGEEGVDWDYSDGTDVSIYGTPSTIVTRNYIWNTPQNKHLNGIGPMDVPLEYMKGVTWNGINSDSEYIDARAQMSYAAYLPKEQGSH